MVPGKHGHSGQCLFVVFPSDLLHKTVPPKKKHGQIQIVFTLPGDPTPWFHVLPRRRSRRQKNVKFDGFPLSPWFPIPFWWIWFHVTQQKAGATYCEPGFALDTYAQLVEVVGFCHVLIEISALLLIKRLILGFIQVIRLFTRIPDQRRNIYPPGNYISLTNALLKLILLFPWWDMLEVMNHEVSWSEWY